MTDAFTQDQLKNIQGAGISGFKKDQQELLFVRFGNEAAARSLLQQLAPRIASAWEVKTFNAVFSEIRHRRNQEDAVEATWIGLAISSAGYQKLRVNLDTELTAADDAAFKVGMAARASAIGDTRSKDAATQWQPAFCPPNRVDALLLVASDDSEDLNERVRELGDLISATGCEVVVQYSGRTLPGDLRGHEHFGGKDGISQPAIDGFDDTPGPNEPGPVAAGEFVLGYPDSSGTTSAVGDLWHDGSFIVYRRLRQDVAAYRQQVAHGIPNGNPPVTGELVGAKLMGRWLSGAPLELNHEQDPGAAGVTNAFEYKVSPFSDDDGQVVPHFAHIRKANPRDETTPDPDLDNPQRHRMIRQGIPFGEPLADGATADDGVERGLHFIAFVADPVRQFEFVQSNWMNNPNFPNGQKSGPGQPYGPPQPGTPADGPDPIAGEHDDGAMDALHQASGVVQFAVITEFVTVSGGEYFFCPSISAVQRLGSGAMGSTPLAQGPPATAPSALVPPTPAPGGPGTAPPA